MRCFFYLPFFWFLLFAVCFSAVCFLLFALCVSLSNTNGLMRDWRFVAQTPQDLCRGDDIFFTIHTDAFQIVLFVVYPVYIRAADIILGRGDTQYRGHEVECNIAAVIAESPEIHGS